MLSQTQLRQKASEAGIDRLPNRPDPNLYCEECGLELEGEWEHGHNHISKQPYKYTQCQGCSHLQIIQLGEGY